MPVLLRIALLLGLCVAGQAAERPTRVLLLSGQNNHDWRATTPKLKAILTGSGRFEVDVTEHPERCDAATLGKYDALLSNWNTFGQAGNPEWPANTRAAFLDFIRKGRGLVVVHAGGSSFLDWSEYQELVGGSWGVGTGHGPIHEFEVKSTAVDHPITRGLEPFKITDELWHRMAMKSTNYTVLAIAFSAGERGGSGRDEPVAFVTRFGQGRCFNLVLGHDVQAMSAKGFEQLLLRGTEWAATGKVTGAAGK